MMDRRLLLVAAMSLAACQTPASGEKGPSRTGLVAVRVDSNRLDEVYTPRKLALLIGIGEYRDESWRDLQFAAKDAEDLAVTLKDPRYGKFDHVEVLTRPEQTTREGILSAIRSLRAKATRPDDVVMVYVSAHGTLARDGLGELRRYLVPNDAEYRNIVGSAVSMDALKNEFDQLPSKRRLLVLATCHSGSGKSLLPPEVQSELEGIKSGFYTRPLEASSRASMVFSASDWGETAREDDGLRNDIYTHFLIEALGGAGDRNEDGAVTATEAHDFARRRTFSFTQGRQRPSAEILEVGADPIILAGEPTRGGRPELYSYSTRLDGFTLKVDGEPRTDLPGGAAVKPGKRNVQLEKGGVVLLDKELEIAAGQRIELEELIQPTGWRKTVTLGGGMFSFVDEGTRSEVFPAMGAGGLSLRLDSLTDSGWSFLVDATGSGGANALNLNGARVPITFQNVSLGGAALYRMGAGRFAFLVGPRLSGLYLQRAFSLQKYDGAQTIVTVAPGVMGGATFALTRRFELSLNAQGSATWLPMDGASRFSVFSGAWAGAGYRF